MRILQRFRSTSLRLTLLALLSMPGLVHAQVQTQPKRRLVTEAVDNNKRVTLPGNTRPESNAANDRGRVPDSLPMEHMELTLRLPAEMEAELQRLLKEIQDPQSPNYHKWLTARQFKEMFSLAPEDIQTIARWLRSQGFQVNSISPRSIDFSGTAGQVDHAFLTEIHNLDVSGVKHIANMSDPQIPTAIAPAVSGIASLNDFRPRPLHGPDRAQH